MVLPHGSSVHPGAADSRIAGRVLLSESKRPLRYAKVRLTGSEKADNTRVVPTDGHGRFVFEQVRPGRYRFEVQALGILPEPWKVEEGIAAQPRSWESQQVDGVVAVAENDSVDLDILVKEGGVLSGSVTFQDGEPARYALVTVWTRTQEGSWEKVPVWHENSFVGYTRTDDAGNYRVAGLRRGSYAVSATVNSVETHHSAASLETRSRPLLLLSYYGGTSSRRAATLVAVEEGKETRNVSILLKDSPTYSVFGQLRGRQSASPVPHTELIIQRDDGDPELENSTFSDAAGRWRFDGLASGSYTITVLPRPSPDVSDPGANSKPLQRYEGYARKQQAVRVDSADIEGVIIELSKGGQLEGKITAEGATLPPQLQVRTIRKEKEGTRPGLLDSVAHVEPDGRFVMRGVSEGAVQLMVLGLDKYLHVSSMLWNGRDLRLDPLQISDDAAVTGIHIVLKPRF